MTNITNATIGVWPRSLRTWHRVVPTSGRRFGVGRIAALRAIPIAATIQAVASELLEERAERINNVLHVVLPDT